MSAPQTSEQRPWRELCQKYLATIIASDDFAELEKRYVALPLAYSGSGRSIAIDDAISKHRTVVLLGTAGAGKSTTVRTLFVATAHQTGGVRLPLYFRLADWGTYGISENAPLEKALLDVMAAGVQQHVPDLSMECVRSSLGAALADDSLLLIFDGLDEIRDSAVRRHAATSIRRLAAGYRKQQVVVAIRKYSFSPELKEDLPFTAVEFSKVDDKSKRALIRCYAPKSVSAESLLRAIHEDFRLARLTDVPMLLRILAEHGASNGARSRGALFKLHVEARVAERFPESVRTSVHDLLTDVAQRIRGRRAADLPEHDPTATEDYPDVERIFQRAKSLFGDLSIQDLRDRLLKTRLVELRERPGRQNLGFSLPQYEDYYLARSIAADLKHRLEPNSVSSVRESAYVGNSDWHDPVVFAAGLLDAPAVERLIGNLRGDNEYLFLRGWILGEVAAKGAERDFIRECKDRIIGRLSAVLVRVSAWCLATLAIWAILLVPATFCYNVLWARNWWISLLLFGSFLTMVPILIRFLYRKSVSHYCEEIRHSLPIELTALGCLQSPSVESALREITWDISEKHSPTGTADDPLSDVIAFAEEQIERCRMLLVSDAETILQEIAEDPDLIRHYLRIPVGGFSSKDYEVVIRYFDSEFSELSTELALVKKLGDVAVHSQELRSRILDFLYALANNRAKEDKLRHAAENNRRRVAERPMLIYVVKDIGTLLRNRRLKRFMVFATLSTFLLIALVLRFGEGGTPVAKVKSLWPLVVAWAVCLLCAMRLYLPREVVGSLFETWKVLTGTGRESPKP